jgi:hypothetical protein
MKELINQTKTNFNIGVDKDNKPIVFKIGQIMEFDENMARTLERYKGIESVESLKSKIDTTFSKKSSKKSKAKSKVEESFDYDSASDEDKASADAAIEADNKE